MHSPPGDPPALADIPYDELVVGRRMGPFAETVSAAMADSWLGRSASPSR